MQARKAFNEWQVDAKNGPGANLTKTLASDYESHFNAQMKKCFVLIESTSTLNVPNGSTSNSAILMDPNERRVYANFLWTTHPTKKYWEVQPAACELIPSFVGAKICASREEFDAFVGRYLEK